MRFKIGETPTLKKDFEVHLYYDNKHIQEDMYKFRGKKVTIDFIGEDFYRIKEDAGEFPWAEELFEDKEFKKELILLDFNNKYCGTVGERVENLCFNDLKSNLLKVSIGDIFAMESGLTLIQTLKPIYMAHGCNYDTPRILHSYNELQIGDIIGFPSTIMGDDHFIVVPNLNEIQLIKETIAEITSNYIITKSNKAYRITNESMITNLKEFKENDEIILCYYINDTRKDMLFLFKSFAKNDGYGYYNEYIYSFIKENK